MIYIHHIIKYSQTRSYFLAVLFFGLCTSAYCQTGDESSKQEVKKDSTTTDTTTSASSEKKELKMSLEVFKINHDLKLVARVRSKVEAKFQNTAGVEISFYKDEIKLENLLGKGISNHKGEAYWIIPLQGRIDSLTSLVFYSSVKDHSDYEDVEETITFNPSRMTINLEQEDSVRLVKIFVGHPDESGKMVPLADAECKVYVKREFGLLEVTEAQTTDADGNISVEFPDDVHGDEAGNVTIVAKIADNESIGNAEVSSTIPWGIPTTVDDFYSQRELWSARANSPISLIIIVNAALLLIWGFIAFIFLEIIRINKLGKTN
ncbi:MAG: hypothetical protein ABJB16_13235 [Saprospiraceae bacterium]